MHMYLVLHNSAIVNSGAVLEDGGNQFSAAPASLELGRNTTEAATTASPLAVQQINNFNFTVGICMVMKDAEAYFEEWVDYHVGVMKFDAIYIYDNSPDFELRNWYRNSRNDPVYGKVEVMHYKSTTKDNWNEKEGGYDQNVIYRDCNDRFGRKGPRHDYLAFIDIDEFLVPQKKAAKSTTTGEDDSTTTTGGGTSIHGILDEYLVPYGGALTVNWVLFGTANKTAYSPFPVTKRFQYRDAETHNVIKSIVKSSDYDGHINPHGVNLSNGAKIRTTEKPTTNDKPHFNHTTCRREVEITAFGGKQLENMIFMSSSLVTHVTTTELHFSPSSSWFLFGHAFQCRIPCNW